MATLERPDPALVAIEPPALGPTRDARREGQPGQRFPATSWPWPTSPATSRLTPASAYLDTLQRLIGFGLDPLQVERSQLERFLARGRRGRWGDWEGPLSSSTQTAELAGLRRFYCEDLMRSCGAA